MQNISTLPHELHRVAIAPKGQNYELKIEVVNFITSIHCFFIYCFSCQLTSHTMQSCGSREHFYMESGIENLPKVSLLSKTTIKPGVVYEYIINNHFYLNVRAGASALIKGGLYKTNRKSVNGDTYVEFTQPITPYFNLGFSYNLF